MNHIAEGANNDSSSAIWFQDDAFWESVFPFMFAEGKFAAAEEEVSKLQNLIGSSFVRVLDLCCGPGRHAIPLDKQGAQVTGVDLSAFLLEKARSRAKAEECSIEWVREDMRTFVRPGQFDLVVNLFTSFGYFGSDDENLSVLRNAFRCLVDGGFFVMDLIGKEVLARRFASSAFEECPDGTIFAQKREIYEDWSRIRVQWLSIRKDNVTRNRFDHALYSGRELIDLLRRAGFRSVRLFGSWNGTPCDLDAQRLIAVAAKSL
jgi:SAM-dependent methyltransferase